MIFDIQRFSIHDGPGIRTTVFFKGCPLGCKRCHNPEGISPAPVLSFMASKCIGCGYCFRACQRAVHSMRGERHVIGPLAVRGVRALMQKNATRRLWS